MEGKVFIRAGHPDDANRDYLPEKCKTTDTVVNENGNNSIVMPERLQECHGVICDGMEDEWYVYVPESYDGSNPVPLIVGLHGGLMTGWGHAIYTSWCLVADREGFICLFPNAHEKRMWPVDGIRENFDASQAPDLPIVLPPEDIKDNHDNNMILGLIQKMEEEYNIDKGRIFMQGMSMGNLMTSQFARNFGDLLAGCAGSGGPSEPFVIFNRDGSVKNRSGALDVWQSRPEKNGLPPGKKYDEFEITRLNRFYWMKINECNPVPQISIRGEDNFAFYKGKKADLVFLDIKNRDHGQTLDEAFLYWDYLFSGARRNEDGTITNGPVRIPRAGDPFAICVSDGYAKAWMNNEVIDMKAPAIWWQKLKYHGLNGGQIIRGEYLCVPLSFLAEAFGARYRSEDENRTVVLTLKDGRHLQFARGSILCDIDNDPRQMFCEALYRNGELLVSMEWFAGYIMNCQFSVCDKTVYVTDHYTALSALLVDLIRDLLAGRPYQDPANYKSVTEQPPTARDWK